MSEGEAEGIAPRNVGRLYRRNSGCRLDQVTTQGTICLYIYTGTVTWPSISEDRGACFTAILLAGFTKDSLSSSRTFYLLNCHTMTRAANERAGCLLYLRLDPRLFVQAHARWMTDCLERHQVSMARPAAIFLRDLVEQRFRLRRVASWGHRSVSEDCLRGGELAQ